MNQESPNPYASPQQAESSSATGSVANYVWGTLFAIYVVVHLTQITFVSTLAYFGGAMENVSRPIAGLSLISLVAPVFFVAVGVAFLVVAAIYGMRRLFLLGMLDLSATFMNFLLLLPAMVD